MSSRNLGARRANGRGMSTTKNRASDINTERFTEIVRAYLEYRGCIPETLSRNHIEFWADDHNLMPTNMNRMTRRRYITFAIIKYFNYTPIGRNGLFHRID